VTALDDVTLVVGLEEPIGHFLYLLSFVPRSRHVVGFRRDWILPSTLTNGPFG
jgi:ABC-type oligopeptide transport system substrate-binding subunit